MMITFLLIGLIGVAAFFSAISLLDSVVRGRRAYRSLTARRKTRPVSTARIVIMGNMMRPAVSDAATTRFLSGSISPCRPAANCLLPTSVAA